MFKYLSACNIENRKSELKLTLNMCVFGEKEQNRSSGTTTNKSFYFDLLADVKKSVMENVSHFPSVPR